MGAWKQFLSSDIIVNPFVVNKGFTFEGPTELTASDVGIDIYLGQNIPWDPIYTNNDYSGYVYPEFNSLVYNSTKQLYYTNFLSSSTGDDFSQRILIPGVNQAGNVYIGSATNPVFDNYLQSTLTPNRYFPSESAAEIVVWSIPNKIYGEYIVPGSLKLNYLIAGTQPWLITDDGQGNLYGSSSAAGFEGNIGNIIYTHGLAVITTTGDSGVVVNKFNTFTYVTCSFSSSMTIYESQYKCTLRESEFNYTLNPSAQVSGSVATISGSQFYQPFDGTPANNVTGSYFAPYVTTVGLYDEMQNLLAVAKLAQPLMTSATTDTTILVNLDF